MARFNEILASRFTRGVNALLRVQELEGLRVLSPELQPVLVVEGDRPDNAYLKGEQWFAFQANVGAIAGQVGELLVENPVNSGLLVVVHRISMVSAAAVGSQYFIGMSDSVTIPGGFTSASGAFLDSRSVNAPNLLPPLKTSASRFRSGTSVAGIASSLIPMQQSLTNQTLTVCDVPFVLTPGFACGVRLQLANTAARFGFVCTERALAPEEISV